MKVRFNVAHNNNAQGDVIDIHPSTAEGLLKYGIAIDLEKEKAQKQKLKSKLKKEVEKELKELKNKLEKEMKDFENLKNKWEKENKNDMFVPDNKIMKAEEIGKK